MKGEFSLKGSKILGILVSFICLIGLCLTLSVSASAYYDEVYIDCDGDDYPETELGVEFDIENYTASIKINDSWCENIVIPAVLKVQNDDWDDWYDWYDWSDYYDYGDESSKRPFTVTAIYTGDIDNKYKSIVIPETVTYIQEESIGYYNNTDYDYDEDYDDDYDYDYDDGYDDSYDEYYDYEDYDLYDERYYSYTVRTKIEDFTIYCIEGSAADIYAENEGFNTVYINNISSADVTLSAESFYFTGSYITPDVSVSYMGNALVAGEDYDVLYFANKFIGKACAVVVGMGEFTGMLIKEFDITTVPASEVVVSEIETEYYTGWEIEPYFNLSYMGRYLDDYEDYTCTFSSNVNPGKGKIEITFTNGIFTGTKIIEFTIAIEPMEEFTVTPQSDSEVYLRWDYVPCGKYYIYRYSSKTKKYERIAKTDKTYYIDEGLTQLKTYKYKVKAVKNSVSNTALSGSATTLLKTPELTLATKNKAAALTWTKNSKADGYIIYRSSNWYDTKKVKTIRDNTVTKWTNKKLNNDYDYYFSIKAYKKVDGKTIYSNVSPTKYSGDSDARVNGANLVSHKSFKVYNAQGKKTTFMYNINLSDSDIKLLDKFKKKHFKSGMTREEQLIVTLDWINKNVTYALGDDWNKISGKSWVEAIFKYKLGQCAQYNGAMAGMMAYLGYDVQVVMGYRGTWKTNYWQHFWTEVKIEGRTYIVETGNYGRSGNWSYLICKYSEAPGYIKNQKNL